MTCIIGAFDRENGQIIMGADSRTSTGSGDVVCANHGKLIYGCKEGAIIGFQGFSMYSTLIANWPELNKWNGDISIFNYIESMREWFDKNGTLKDNGCMDSTSCMIAWKGGLYQIGMDFSIIKTQGEYFCIGSGGQVALGAMYAQEVQADAPYPTTKESIETALEAAGHHICSVGPPYHFKSIPLTKPQPSADI